MEKKSCDSNEPEPMPWLEGLSDFLYLHDNRLSTLPSSLGRLKRLRYLNQRERLYGTARLPLWHGEPDRVAREIARNSVESQRPSELIDYATFRFLARGLAASG